MALFSAERGSSDACSVHLTVTELNPEAGTLIVAAASDPAVAEALPVPGALQSAHAATIEAASTSAIPSAILRSRRGVIGPPGDAWEDEWTPSSQTRMVTFPSS
jgi:hypothetical protein